MRKPHGCRSDTPAAHVPASTNRNAFGRPPLQMEQGSGLLNQHFPSCWQYGVMRGFKGEQGKKKGGAGALALQQHKWAGGFCTSSPAKPINCKLCLQRCHSGVPAVTRGESRVLGRLQGPPSAAGRRQRAARPRVTGTGPQPATTPRPARAAARGHGARRGAPAAPGKGSPLPSSSSSSSFPGLYRRGAGKAAPRPRRRPPAPPGPYLQGCRPAPARPRPAEFRGSEEGGRARLRRGWGVVFVAAGLPQSRRFGKQNLQQN